VVDVFIPDLVGAIFGAKENQNGKEVKTVSLELKNPNMKTEKYSVAQEFGVAFKFQDGEKIWTSRFWIKVTDLGTPKLMKVEIEGSKAKHPKPLTRSYTSDKMKDFLNESQGVWATKEELEEYQKLDPEPDSVTRLQIKRTEQYRFQLYELALRIAIEHGEPVSMKDPDGVLHKVYLQKTLEEAELRRISKLIGKKIRLKIKDELLEEVAKIYTESALAGLNPIQEIMAFYKCSNRTAQSYAEKARKSPKKFLPETTPGKITVKKPRKRKETKK